MKNGSIPIIVLRHDLKNGDHIFSLEDNGVGIKDTDKAKVFDLFEQSDKKNDGYGIGLSLCRDIVQMHKGKIWVDPDYDGGCRICFKIPDQMA
jgi:signal transduction histidine kinase